MGRVSRDLSIFDTRLANDAGVVVFKVQALLKHPAFFRYKSLLPREEAVLARTDKGGISGILRLININFGNPYSI